MSITFLNLFIAILATWRISSLVSNELGPFYMFSKIRTMCAHLQKENRFFKSFHIYELITCEWCNGMWFAAAFTPLWRTESPLVLVVLPFAISTGAIIVKYVVQILRKGGE